MLLSPPRPARNRASSTSLRPPLSLPTLAARTPSCCAPDLPPIPPTPAASAQSGQPFPDDRAPPGMVPTLLSRTLQLVRLILHYSSSKPLLPSPAISPRSSADIDDDYILPLATPTKTSFDVVYEPAGRLRLASSAHTPLLFVLVLFPVTTGLVLMSLSTLPITFVWPSNLQDLTRLGRELGAYSQSGALSTLHVLAVLGFSATWKHAWSIPGAVLWNVLAGALFHPFLATVLMTTLTALGSVLSTLLAAPLAPILTRFLPRSIDMTRSVLEGSSASASPAWARLSVLRLIGLVPWSGLNVACGIAHIRLVDCFLGAFIGTLPWTAVTCQIGDILQTVAADNTVDGEARTISSLLATPQTIIKLVFLTVLSLAPILGRKKLGQLLSPAPANVETPRASPLGSEPTPTTATFSEYSNWSPTSTSLPLDEEKDAEQIQLTLDVDELVIAPGSRRYGSGHSRWPSWSLKKPKIAKIHFPFGSIRSANAL